MGSHWYSGIWGRQNIQPSDRTVKAGQIEIEETGSMQTADLATIDGQNLHNTGKVVDVNQRDSRPGVIKETGGVRPTDQILVKQKSEPTVNAANSARLDPSQRETKGTSRESHWYSGIWGRQISQPTDRAVIRADQPGPSQAEETGSVGSTPDNYGITGGQTVRPMDRTANNNSRQQEIKETVSVRSTQSNSGIAGKPQSGASDVTVDSIPPETRQRETKETATMGASWYSAIWSRQNVHTVETTDRTVKAAQPGPSQAEVTETGSVGYSRNSVSASGGQNLQPTDRKNSDQPNPNQSEISETVSGGSTNFDADNSGGQNLKTPEKRVKFDQLEPSKGETKQTGCLGTAPWYSCILSRQNLQLIDRTVKAGEEDPAQEEIKEITKKHWVNAKSRTKCSRKQCRKRFSFVEKPHHCRRCGEVFCVTCVQWRRKLNTLAKPDPDGKECRVCQACFEVEPQEIGCTRDHRVEFREAKLTSEAYQSAKAERQMHRGWRNRFELDMECARLVKGFGEELQRWDIAKALVEMKKMMVVPYWQRGANWLQEATRTTCGSCETPFNLLFNKKSHCRVCATAVCFNCSSRRLIVYVPNSEVSGERRPWNWLTLTQEYREPRLAVIEIVGCPEEEPEICLYLRVCDRCLQALTEIQVRDHGISLTVPEEDFLSRLTSLWEEFSLIQESIDDRLHKFSSTIDLLEDSGTINASGDANSQDITRKVANLENDLTNFFTEYSVKVEQLKKFRRAPSSPAQAKLLQNFIKTKYD
ncbi:uncharacterized protein LOC135479700 [Liolophura sinensis]|uniref:uncharacterized protein LOC135479700 n=1 Tax=Liolophura sinensis TaxID=3198878 RepID=UPI003158302F